MRTCVLICAQAHQIQVPVKTKTVHLGVEVTRGCEPPDIGDGTQTQVL